MRILAVTNMYPSPEFPASGVFVHEQVKSLQAIGLDVRVLLIDRRREGAPAYYRMDSKLTETVGGFNPDLIHVMYGGVMANRVARRHHVRPLVITFHGSDLLGENLSGWARRAISRYGVWCSRKSAKAADGVVVVARHLLNALPPAVRADKVRVLPCGIDLERFKPLDPQQCRHALGWNSEGFHLLFASSNGDPVKRPWLANAAVEQVRGRGLPAELHYLTGVPNVEVPVWLSASDALLLTSLHEGSPTVVKEAIACGLPVVSVDVGDVAERIEKIDGCHLAQPNPADLADKVCKVLFGRRRLECRDQLGELSVLSVARKLEGFYESVARHQPKAQNALPARDLLPGIRASA